MGTNKVKGDLKFHEVVKTPTFIDKTLFLKYIYEKKNCVMAFLAPSRFGKSVNMSMVQEFFEAHVDSKGNILPQKESPFYEIFFDPEKNIWKADNGAFVTEHFAKYPVVMMDLRQFSANENHETYMKGIMAELYSKYQFLAESKELRESQKTRFKFISTNLLTESGSLDNAEGKFLLDVLHTHFKNDTFILIDEFDAPVKGALNGATFGDTEIRALNYLSHYLGLMCKDPPHVYTVAFTGITQLGRTMSYHINIINYISAFDNETISEFYGCTEDEIKMLAAKLGKQALLAEMTAYYKGYCVKNSSKSVYNTQSVTSSLMRGTVEPFWDARERLHKFEPLFAYDVFGAAIEKTLLDLPMTVRFDPIISTGRLIKFQKMLSKTLPRSEISATEQMLFFQYLQEQGFFTIEEEYSTILRTVAIKIPNEEIRVALQSSVYTSNFFAKKFQTDVSVVEKYLQVLKNLDGSHAGFTSWKEAVLQMFRKKLPKNEREITAPLFTFPWIAESSISSLVRSEEYKKTDLKETGRKEGNADVKTEKKENVYGGKFDTLIVTRERRTHTSRDRHTAINVGFEYNAKSASGALKQILNARQLNLDQFEKKARNIPGVIDNTILIGLAWTQDGEWDVWALHNSRDMKDAFQVK